MTTLGGTNRLGLDVYQPAGSNLPAVMLIHGGGFSHGDKCLDNVNAIAQQLELDGLVVFSVNYRLTCDINNPPPSVSDDWLCTGEGTGTDYEGAPVEPLVDVRTALHWIRVNGATYGVNTSRVAVLGTSAGGALAGLLGVTGTEGDDRADAVSAWSGGANFADPSMNQSPKIKALLGCPYSDPDPALDCPGDWENFSPYYNCCGPANTGAATLLLLFNSENELIPVVQLDQMWTRVSGTVIKITAVELDGMGHGAGYFDTVLDIGTGSTQDHLRTNQSPEPALNGKKVWEATADWFKDRL